MNASGDKANALPPIFFPILEALSANFSVNLDVLVAFSPTFFIAGELTTDSDFYAIYSSKVPLIVSSIVFIHNPSSSSTTFFKTFFTFDFFVFVASNFVP